MTGKEIQQNHERKKKKRVENANFAITEDFVKIYVKTWKILVVTPAQQTVLNLIRLQLKKILRIFFLKEVLVAVHPTQCENFKIFLTVWKFKDFSATQNLREITFNECRVSKAVFEAHNLISLQICVAENFLNYHTVVLLIKIYVKSSLATNG